MLKIIQGDTWTKLMQIQTGTGAVRPYDSDDIVRFALASDRDVSKVVYSKTMTYVPEKQAYSVTLSASETAALSADRQYWFDIGVQFSDDTFSRVVACQEIKIIPGLARAVISS